MAKLKINEGTLQAEIVPVEKVEAPKVEEKVTPKCDLTNVNEELDALRLETISLGSELERLSEKLKVVERPIVKEITLDKTNSDDLDALERSLIKTVDKLNSDRKEELSELEKNVTRNQIIQLILNAVFVVNIITLILTK